MNYQRHLLDNGLRVIFAPVPKLGFTAFALSFRAARPQEPIAKAGMAHMLEHLMYAGTPENTSFDAWLQELASNDDNAWTSFDETQYFSTVPTESLEGLLWAEGDRWTNLLIEDEFFKNEKNVILEEYRETKQETYQELEIFVNKKLYENHPYETAIIGKNIKEIKNIKKEEILAFKQTYYTPQNAVLVLSGDFEPETTLKQVEKYFSHIPKGPEIQNISWPKPIFPSGKTYKVKGKTGDLNSLTFVFPAADFADSTYQYDSLLNSYLTEGMNTFFFEEMIEKLGCCDSINIELSDYFQNNTFIIDIRLLEGFSFKEVKKHFIATLDAFLKRPIPDNFVATMRKAYRIMLLDPIDQLAFDAARLATWEQFAGIEGYQAFHQFLLEGASTEKLQSHLLERLQIEKAACFEYQVTQK